MSLPSKQERHLPFPYKLWNPYGLPSMVLNHDQNLASLKFLEYLSAKGRNCIPDIIRVDRYEVPKAKYTYANMVACIFGLSDPLLPRSSYDAVWRRPILGPELVRSCFSKHHIVSEVYYEIKVNHFVLKAYQCSHRHKVHLLPILL